MNIERKYAENLVSMTQESIKRAKISIIVGLVILGLALIVLVALDYI